MAQRTKRDGTVLVVGATGSVGRLVVAEAVRQGYSTRALVRDVSRAGRLDPGALKAVGELTRAETLTSTLAPTSTPSSPRGPPTATPPRLSRRLRGAEERLHSLGGRGVRVALMTAIGVTGRGNSHDWKCRGERLVRASDHSCTIVRPGWFDVNDDDELQITLLQGDTRHRREPRRRGDRPSPDRPGLRRQPRLRRGRSPDLRTGRGARAGQDDLEPAFARLDKDPLGSVDGIRDQANMPAEAEPERVRRDLSALAVGD